MYELTYLLYHVEFTILFPFFSNKFYSVIVNEIIYVEEN